MEIKKLFEKGKDIYRGIEKVVTFGNASEEYLDKEISEYVVTERLRDNFENILDALSTGMTHGSNEIGIWVSGFYGSGKSSFAKYLGFALDSTKQAGGTSFTERLINRLDSKKAPPLLKGIIKNHNPAIVLLDCATEQIKGGTLPPILELLIAKVNQIAGYSTDSRLSYLEMMLERDGKLDTFKTAIKSENGQDWDDIKINSLLEANALAAKQATKLYPNIWEDAKAFRTTKLDDSRTDKQKVTELLSTVKSITGKEKVIFIVDEVGQYIAAKDGLILSLQGTMENLKDIGGGNAWLIATAQQTLTEDNPNAKLNSDKLYKLNARFPVPAEIEASDIKEICTQRLLGKSTDASSELKSLYQKHGEKLKHFSNLENCDKQMYTKEPLDEKLFVSLYPFLPQHFAIIISLLGRLAKITGGVGLRSAIKVIQDVLTDNLPSEDKALAEYSIGKLASTYHIYDVLRNDIRKSYSHVVAAVDKIVGIDGDDSYTAKVAKSIGLLQLLDDFHLSAKNVAALMNDEVRSEDTLDRVNEVIEDLKSRQGSRLNELDGQLKFMTEAIVDLENQKDQITINSTNTRKVYENILKDIYSPVPMARLQNTKAVKTGINFFQLGRLSKIAETNEEIQTEIIIASQTTYDKDVAYYTTTSTESAHKNRIYLIGKLDEDVEKDVAEIVRCEELYTYRHKYDNKEIIDYLNSQDQRAHSLKDQLRRSIIKALEKGEFVFRGGSKPVKFFGEKLKEATNKKLKEVAELVFDKYHYAAINVPGSDVEKLLKFRDFKSVPQNLNHYELIQPGGKIDLTGLAIQSIKEYIDQTGYAEGKALLEKFANAPYGWSKDTTRYFVSLMFIASSVKLRISGHDIKVISDSSIQALKNVNGFNKTGISLYEQSVSPEMSARAVQRLAELTGETIAPLPNDIAAAVRIHFPAYLQNYAGVKTDLEYLKIPFVSKAKDVEEGIKNLLEGDASDAGINLGQEESTLFSDLKWIKEVHAALAKGMKNDFQVATRLKDKIDSLPDSGLLIQLKADCEEQFSIIDEIVQDENFVRRLPDFKDAVSKIKIETSDYCQKLLDESNAARKKEIHKIQNQADWNHLNAGEKEELNIMLNATVLEDKQGIKGIEEIISSGYAAEQNFAIVRDRIVEYKTQKEKETGLKVIRKSLTHHSKKIENEKQLDAILDDLTALKPELKNGPIQIDW